jgi:hypothetical protein
MLLGEWSADDVTAKAYPVSIKLEALLSVTRGKSMKVLQIIVEFPAAWMEEESK